MFAGRSRPGLLLATNWRVIFIRPGGEFAAFPMPKIEVARTVRPAQLILSVWYGRLVLAFDHCATALAVETRLQQGPIRMGALTPTTGAGPDLERCADLPLRQAAEGLRGLADHHLLMLEPSL